MNNKISLIFIIAVFTFSCRQPKSTDKTDFVRISDNKDKFSIDIPENWHFELNENNRSSIIIFSDTTREFNNLLVLNVMWDSSNISLNDHFKKSLDSIVVSFGFTPFNQEFKSINEFKAYSFNTIGYDSLNQTSIYETHYYLKQQGKDGSIKFTIRRNNKTITKQDIALANTILNSVKRN